MTLFDYNIFEIASRHIEAKLQEKDRQIEILRQQDSMNKDALIILSEQLLRLSKNRPRTIITSSLIQFQSFLNLYGDIYSEYVCCRFLSFHQLLGSSFDTKKLMTCDLLLMPSLFFFRNHATLLDVLIAPVSNNSIAAAAEPTLTIVHIKEGWYGFTIIACNGL
jgi:hypothetical protein